MESIKGPIFLFFVLTTILSYILYFHLWVLRYFLVGLKSLLFELRSFLLNYDHIVSMNRSMKLIKIITVIKIYLFLDTSV